MPSALFAIEPADLQKKIAPSASDYEFAVGDDAGDDLSTADAIAILEEQEQMVESYLRERYRRLLRRVDGEVLVRKASAGQTTATLKMKPVGTLHLYMNYPRARAWSDKSPSERLDAAKFTVDAPSGLVTFAPALSENDRVWADYTHAGASALKDLRHLVLNLAAVEVARRFAYFRSAEGFNRFEQWQTSAAGHLRDLGRTDGAQIPVFDEIDLVNETRALSLGDL